MRVQNSTQPEFQGALCRSLELSFRGASTLQDSASQIPVALASLQAHCDFCGPCALSPLGSLGLSSFSSSFTYFHKRAHVLREKVFTCLLRPPPTILFPTYHKTVQNCLFNPQPPLPYRLLIESHLDARFHDPVKIAFGLLEPSSLVSCLKQVR